MLSGEALELAAAWMAVNQGTLASLRRASERPVLYVPVDDWAMSSLNPLAMLQAQRVLACGAALRLRQGDETATTGAVLRRVNAGFDLLERAAKAPTLDARIAALARANKVLEERSERRPRGFEAVTCRLSATRKWCMLDQYVADLTAWSKSVGLATAAPRLHAKIALIEDTRRALLAAQARR